MERVRMKNMASAKEYEEILQRFCIASSSSLLLLCPNLTSLLTSTPHSPHGSHKEERAKEMKRMEAERRLHTELMQKQRKVKAEREVILGRIRMGNFMYHQGKLGYYDNVRDEQQPFIQYEDDQGYPYYLDPITLKTEYTIPSGAPVIHHTVKERLEYDRLYGDGAYDQVQEDRKWKEKCNIDGGYWENGSWVELQGYYDENYEFISFY
jgi:hypothetical protein